MMMKTENKQVAMMMTKTACVSTGDSTVFARWRPCVPRLHAPSTQQTTS